MSTLIYLCFSLFLYMVSVYVCLCKCGRIFIVLEALLKNDRQSTKSLLILVVFSWHINPFRVIKRWIKFQAFQLNISIIFVYKQFYFKQFSLTYVHNFNFKNSSISNNSDCHIYTISMSKTVLFQTIQTSLCTKFFNLRTVLFLKVQFSISMSF